MSTLNISVIVVEWILCVLASMVLGLRLWVRLHISKVGITLEDIFLIIAQILFFVWISMDVYTNSRGFMSGALSYLQFPETFNSNPTEEVRVLKVVYSSAVPYYLCLWLMKYALLAFYYKIIPADTKNRIFLHVTAAIAVASSVVIILLNLFLCRPISLNWKLEKTGAHCYSSTSITPFIVSVLLNVVVDLLIFILPFPLLRHLKINRKQIWGLVATFSLGIITMIVIVIRAVISGLTGNIVQVAILTAVECFTSMVVVCLPALRPLLKTVGEKRRMKQRSASQAQFAKSGTLSPSVNEVDGQDDDSDFSDGNSDDEDDLDSVASYNGHHPHGFNSPSQTDTYRMSTLGKSGPGFSNAPSLYSDNSSVMGSPGMAGQRLARSSPPQRFDQNSMSQPTGLGVVNGVNSSNRISGQYVPKRQHQDFGFEEESYDNANHIGFDNNRNLYDNSNNGANQANRHSTLSNSSDYGYDTRRSMSPPPHQPRARHAQGASMYMSSPLPVPPRPTSTNDDEDYIMPSYILNEPLPNPVI